MFKKLRNKLILINLGITSFVIVMVFATIYIISTRSAENRPVKFLDSPPDVVFSDEWENTMRDAIRVEKEASARELLIILIVSGITIEIVVVLISYFLAEEAIKPVKDAYNAQKVFIANASHEIKTPLAAISANLEAADITNNKWISNVALETEKLVNLNNQLLTLARTDLMTDTQITEVNLGDLLEKTLNSFSPRLKQKTLTKKITLDKNVKINASDFEQILSILMDNAVKYSDKKISVALSEHRLEVSNDGIKIPKDKLAHIFDRFYQADKTSEGVGLGLSIAKSIADKNHFKLMVKSDKLTTFILEF